jgi:hypothetical protein
MSLKGISEYNYLFEMDKEESDEYQKMLHDAYIKKALGKHEPSGKLKKGEKLSDSEESAINKEHLNYYYYRQNLEGTPKKPGALKKSQSGEELMPYEEEALRRHNDPDKNEHLEMVLENRYKSGKKPKGLVEPKTEEPAKKESKPKTETTKANKEEPTKVVNAEPVSSEVTDDESEENTTSMKPETKKKEPTKVATTKATKAKQVISTEDPKTDAQTYTETQAQAKSKAPVKTSRVKTVKKAAKTAAETSTEEPKTDVSSEPEKEEQLSLDFTKTPEKEEVKTNIRKNVKAIKAMNAAKTAAETSTEKPKTEPESQGETSTEKPKTKAPVKSRAKKTARLKPTYIPVTGIGKEEDVSKGKEIPYYGNLKKGGSKVIPFKGFAKPEKEEKKEEEKTPSKPKVKTEIPYLGTKEDIAKARKERKKASKPVHIPFTKSKEKPKAKDIPVKIKREPAQQDIFGGSTPLSKVNKHTETEEPETTVKDKPNENQTSLKFLNFKTRKQRKDGSTGPQSSSKILKRISAQAKEKASPDKEVSGGTNVPVKIKPQISITHTPSKMDPTPKRKSFKDYGVIPSEDTPYKTFIHKVKQGGKVISKKVGDALRRAKEKLSGYSNGPSEKQSEPTVKQEPQKIMRTHNFDAHVSHPDINGGKPYKTTVTTPLVHREEPSEDYIKKWKSHIEDHTKNDLEGQGYTVHNLEHTGMEKPSEKEKTPSTKETAEWIYNGGKGRTQEETANAPIHHQQSLANNTEEINAHLRDLHKASQSSEPEDRSKKIVNKLRATTEKLREEHEAHSGITPYDSNDCSAKRTKEYQSFNMWQTTEKKKIDKKKSEKYKTKYDKGAKEEGDSPNYGAYIHFHKGIHPNPIYVKAGDEYEARGKVKKIVKEYPEDFDNNTVDDVKGVSLYGVSKEKPYRVKTGHIDRNGKVVTNTRTVYHDNKSGAHNIGEMMHIYANKLHSNTEMVDTSSQVLPKELIISKKK